MKNRTVAGCILGLLALFACEARAGETETIKTGGLEITVDALSRAPKEAITSTASQSLNACYARIVVIDGKTKKELQPQSATGIRTSGGRSTYTAKYEGFNLCHILTKNPGYISWKIECENKSEAQRWLEIGLECRAQTPSQVKYWDGAKETNAPKLPQEARERFHARFPMHCIWDTNAGIAIGISPGQYLSYLQPSLLPQTNGLFSLNFNTRIVVDPKKPETAEFLVFDFDRNYGFFGALQAYYDFYPACFYPAEDITAKIYGSRATFGFRDALVWAPTNGPAFAEEMRRMFGSVEWVYAPFKRTGDLIMRPEFFDYKQLAPGHWGWTIAKTREDMLKLRERVFTVGGEDFGMFFYTPSGMWCEEQLANLEYSESLIKDEGMQCSIDNWVCGNCRDVSIFPWGGKYGEVIKEDFIAITKSLDISGFAFDVPTGCERYYGVLKNGFAGRAYDEHGVFVSGGIGIAEEMDFVHSLKKKGRRLAVWGNPWAGNAYMVAFRTDFGLHERPVYDAMNDPFLHRYLMGHKPIINIGKYEVEGNYPYWEKMSAAEMKEAYRDLRDAFLLSSFRLGYVPAGEFFEGVPKLYDAMPMLIEVLKAGWEPVTAIRDAGDELWCSRYGRDTGAYLCIGNPLKKALSKTINVDSKYFAGKPLFALFDGTETPQKTGSRGVEFQEMNFPGRNVTVLKCMALLPPDSGITAAKLAETKDISCRVLTCALTSASGSAEKLKVGIPENFSVAKVAVNQKEVRFRKQKPRSVEFTADFVKGDNAVEVTYQSDIFGSTASELKNFKYVSEDLTGPLADIVISGNGGAEEKKLAQRIGTYFSWYANTKGKSLGRVPVVSRRADRSLPGQIIIDLGGANPEGKAFRHRAAKSSAYVYTPEPGTLYMYARDYAGFKEMLASFLRLLDQKYKYYGPFLHPIGGGKPLPAAEKAGVWNGILD